MTQKNKIAFTFAGFLLFLFGFLALCLTLIGVRFTFFKFIDQLGALPSFIIKLFMIMLGIILLVLAQTDFRGEDLPTVDKVESK